MALTTGVTPFVQGMMPKERLDPTLVSLTWLALTADECHGVLHVIKVHKPSLARKLGCGYEPSARTDIPGQDFFNKTTNHFAVDEEAYEGDEYEKADAGAVRIQPFLHSRYNLLAEQFMEMDA